MEAWRIIITLQFDAKGYSESIFSMDLDFFFVNYFLNEKHLNISKNYTHRSEWARQSFHKSYYNFSNFLSVLLDAQKQNKTSTKLLNQIDIILFLSIFKLHWRSTWGENSKYVQHCTIWGAFIYLRNKIDWKWKSWYRLQYGFKAFYFCYEGNYPHKWLQTLHNLCNVYWLSVFELVYIIFRSRRIKW